MPIPQLADIHLPDPVANFPWAPGWWMLLGLCVLAAAATGWWFYQRARRNRYRRQAAKELRALDPALDDQRLASAINQLLRRTALQASGRDVATLTGDEWYQYLRRHGGKTRALERPIFDTWQAVAYGAAAELDRDAVFDFAAQWLRYHQSRPAEGRRISAPIRRAGNAGI